MSEKTKTIKELLILLRKEVEECRGHVFTGMCGRITALNDKNQITQKEYWMLYDYLDDNTPDGCENTNEYWWAKGLKTFRLDWLDEYINDLP